MNWSKTLHSIQLKLSRPLVYSLLCAFFAYCTLSCYTYFLLRQQSGSSQVNTLCSLKDPPEYCDMTGNQHQFSKFLLFATDCWPVSYAKEVLEHFKDHSITYFIDIPGAKYSHAIYTSYLTGQLPTNYKGDPIKGDHLVRSMMRSGTQGLPTAHARPISSNYKLRYIGPEWSFLAILGKENYDTFFEDVKIEKEPLDIAYQHPYPFFFEGNWDFFNSYLQELKNNRQSMLAHSGVFDHRQHGEHRGLGPSGKSFPRTDKMAKIMQSDFKQVKSWIDKNPDYLLVLLSDHGVDQYGVGGYRMHGDAVDGNEPFILLYNPKLEAKPERRIDIVDVAPTLALYFPGVDIPANSMGVTRAFFGNNKTEYDMKALKQNVAQLSQAARHKGISVDQTELKRLLNLPYDSPNNYKQLLNFAETIKTNMYQAMEAPWIRVTLFTVCASAIMLYILIHYNEGLERYVFANQYLGFLGELWNILMVYGLMFLQLLFCWWNWGTPHDGGYAYRVLSPGLALLIIFNLRNSNPNPATSHHKDKLAAATASSHFGEQCLYRNEVLNLVLAFLTTSFPDLLDVIDSTPGFSEIVTALAFALLQGYYMKKRPQYLASASSLSPTSLLAQQRDQRFARYTNFGFSVMLFLVHLEAYTEENPMLFVRNFHIFALPTYLLGVILPIYILLTQKVVLDMVMPINLVLWMLLRDSPIRRSTLLLINVQFISYILPLIEVLRIWVTESANSRRDSFFFQSASVTHQAGIVYAINQVLFTFCFGFGDKINFDVHPFAGRVGLDAYDRYPALSAFLMTFHKYGVFALFCVFAVSMLYLRVSRDPDTDGINTNNGVANGNTKDPMTNYRGELLWDGPQTSTTTGPNSAVLSAVSRWLTDTMTCALMLFFCLTNLGTWLMYWVVTRHHPYQQATAMTLLLGTTGAVYCLFMAILSFREQRSGSTGASRDRLYQD